MRGAHRSIVVVVAAVLAMVGSACTVKDGPVATGAPAPTTTPTAPTTTTTEPQIPDPAPLSWKPCPEGGGLECATLSVPLDYAKPSGRHIDLAVARHPVADPSQRIGSLLVNPGGPGASGIDILAGAPVPPEVAQRFDVVSWDPRGVRRSEGLNCGQGSQSLYGLDPAPDTEREQQAIDNAGQALAKRCASDPDLLAHLDTGSTADDLEQIRRALGEDQISYLGYSYGTLIGQMYAERYPDRLRALVLDGVLDPSKPMTQWLTDLAVGVESSLAELGPVYDQLEAEAEQTPLPTSDGSTVGPAEMALAALSTGHVPYGHEVLAQALELAQQGNAALVSALAGSWLNAGTSFASYVAINCVDAPHPTGADGWKQLADQAAAVAPRLGASAINEAIGCAFWQVPPVGTPGPISPTGLAPSLVIGNTGDFITPLVNAQQVATNIAGARLLTVDIDGHTATLNDLCASEAVSRYLIDGQLPAEGTVCP